MGRDDPGVERAHGRGVDGLSAGPATKVVCAGCGYVAPPEEAFPFACPRERNDDTDHVLVRSLDPAAVRFPTDADANPFVRYRQLFHGYHLGRLHGLDDDEHVALVRGLDDAVAEVDGHGFVETPFAPSEALSGAIGCSVWVKDETGNVAGSHKSRHLMGLMVHLLVAELAGLAPDLDADLAIASCGNAALAAAVVARAARRRLRVFVPAWADPNVLGRLRELGAVVERCERVAGVPGDPSYHAMRRALADGAIPFTCQGPDNGLTIEGGQTLGFELLTRLTREHATLDRLVIQVGGGALASSCARAFDDASRLGALDDIPRLHAVQTLGAHPLERAYTRVRERLGNHTSREHIDEAMTWARTHRSRVMWPWEEEPRSIAEGILDDETYDWAAVVEAMLATGGGPILVSEDRLREANDLASSADIDASYTGTAGLAGLLELADMGALEPGERIGVIATGTRNEARSGEAQGASANARAIAAHDEGGGDR